MARLQQHHEQCDDTADGGRDQDRPGRSRLNPEAQHEAKRHQAQIPATSALRARTRATSLTEQPVSLQVRINQVTPLIKEAPETPTAMARRLMLAPTSVPPR